MSRIRYMLGNINLINIMLMGILILLINYILPFMNTTISYTPRIITKHEEIAAGKNNGTDQDKTPSFLDYMIINEQNLFHPDRKIPEETKSAAPLPKPDLVLYGTLITDDTTIAYMEDKKSRQNSPGRGNRQVAVKLGSSIGGFILKEVAPEKVVMVRGEESIVVLLDDPKNPKQRETPTSEPAGAGTQQKPASEPPLQAPPAQQKQSLPQSQPSAISATPAASKTTSRDSGGGTAGGGGLLRFMGR